MCCKLWPLATVLVAPELTSTLEKLSVRVLPSSMLW
jgi:hypothetical protein